MIDGTVLSLSADVNLDRTRRDPIDDDVGSTVVSTVSSFPPLDLLAFSFFSSITRCKRSVSMSCSATIDGVDGAPILLLDKVTLDASITFVAGSIDVEIVDELSV